MCRRSLASYALNILVVIGLIFAPLQPMVRASSSPSLPAYSIAPATLTSTQASGSSHLSSSHPRITAPPGPRWTRLGETSVAVEMANDERQPSQGADVAPTNDTPFMISILTEALLSDQSDAGDQPAPIEAQEEHSIPQALLMADGPLPFFGFGQLTDATSPIVHNQTAFSAGGEIPLVYTQSTHHGATLLPTPDEHQDEATIPLQQGPADLTPTGMTAPAVAVAGRQISVSWTVRNQGTGPTQTNSWNDNWYLSTDNVWDALDTSLGGLFRNQVLAAADSYTQTLTVTVPNRPAGDYFLILRVDVSNYLYEADETNNAVSQSLAIRIPVAVTTPLRILESSQDSGCLWSSDFSPDGARLVATRASRALTWDLLSGELRAEFTAHTNLLTSVAFSLDGDLVLSGAYDGTARLWDSVTLQQIRSFPAASGLPNPAVFSTDGAWVLAGSGRQPRLWDVATGAELRTFSDHTSEVWAVALSPDGSKALIGDADGTAIIWDTATGARLLTLARHSDHIFAVAFSPDGRQFLTASADRRIRVWDSTSGAPIAVFIQNAEVWSALFSADGRYVISGDFGVEPGIAYLWEIATGALVSTFSLAGSDPSILCGVSVSPDQTVIATGHSDGQMRLWSSGLPSATPYRITPLAVGSELTVTLQSYGAAYYEIETHAGRNLVITLGSATGGGTHQVTDSTAVRMLVKQGSVPTVYDYDYSAQAPLSRLFAEIPIVPTAAGKYYVLVTAPFLSGGSLSTTIRADYTELHISSVSPEQGGNTGDVTVRLRGTGFTDDTVAWLVAPGGARISGAPPIVENSTEMFVTFNLRGAATGRYTIQVEKPGADPDVLAAAFRVTGGVGSSLQAPLFAPSAIRAQGYSVFWVEYSNTGDADMVAPLLVISSEPPVPMSLRPDAPYQKGPLQVLGINFDGPAGVLPPGARYRIPVYFQAATSGGRLDFKVDMLVADATPIDWAAIEPEIRPDDIDPAGWSLIWASLKDQFGATWANYLQAMGQDATYLARYGSRTYDARELFALEFSRAAGLLSPRRSLALMVDAYAPGRVLPLTFVRSAPATLDQRYRLGPLGRGWFHSFEYTLTQPDNNTVVITGPGGGRRRFVRAALGQPWLPLPGDYASLEALGGAFLLREKDGISRRFNADGRLETIEEPNGNRINLTYTSDRLTRVSHSNGQSLTLAYTTQGRIERLTDHAGRVTRYEYDTDGEYLEAVVAPGNRRTIYTNGLLTGNPTGETLRAITYPDNTHEYFAYDTRGRLNAYWRDNNTERMELTYSASGAVRVTDALDAVTMLRFGARGQILDTRDPVGNQVRFNYDSRLNLTRVRGPDGSAVEMIYDVLGNVTEMVNPLGYTIRMGYTHDRSRLDWLIDARGNATDFGVDSRGNLTSITYADASVETYGYDAMGNLTSLQNRRDVTITYAYDSAGNLTRKTYPDGRTVAFSYDTRGNLTLVADSVTGVITQNYDSRDFLTRIEYPGGRWFTFEYNDAGRRTRRTGDDGDTLNYHYDAAGRLARLTNGVGAEIVRYAYYENGRLSRETKGNGTYTIYAYDAAGHLLHLVNHAPDGAVQSRFDYTYDVKGNRTSMTTLAGMTQYAYDALSQLTGVTYPDGRQVTYTYDPAGNRTAVSDNSVTTAYATNYLNQYTQVGTEVYTYDADGNLTARLGAGGTTTYEYDGENRLVRVATPTSGTWRYTYDAMGNRVAVDHDGAVTRYVHDPAGLVDVAAEYDSSDGLVARYVHGLGLVARVEASGAAAYYAYDGTGHTRQLTDAGGAVANSYDYDPFGVPLQTTETVPNPFRYVGRLGVMTEANGLHLMQARFYAPAIGRFISVDPLRIGGGEANLYEYAANSPIMIVDPSGRVVAVPGLFLAAELLGLADYYLYRYASTVIGILGAVDVGLSPGPSVIQHWTQIPVVLLANLGQSIAMAAWLANALMEGGYGILWGWYLIGELLVDLLSTLIQWILDVLIPIEPPVVPGQGVASGSTSVIRSSDPNDKLGPPGVGDMRVVSWDDTLHYTINFENMASATAPVQEVIVVDYLDPDLDWTTLRFSELAYGDRLIVVPQNVSHFATRDFPTGITIMGTVSGTLAIDLTATLNPQTGRLEWRMRAIDTATGLPPADPLAGFLPPENGSGRGQGHVSFSLRPKPGVASGTRLTNSASIVFDVNDPIATNEVWNTVGELGRLELSAVGYTVTESGGHATITVIRRGGSAGTVSVNYATSDRTARAGADYSATSGTVTFADGDTTDKTVTIPIVNDGLAEGDETLTVTLSDPTGGATLGVPNTAIITITDDDVVPSSADLALNKTASSDTVSVGSTFTYSLRITNAGPDAVTDAYLTDVLPPGVSLGAVTASQGSCSEVGGIVTCSIGALAPSAIATVTLVVTPTMVETLRNTASVVAGVTDPNMTNNSASATTTVTTAPGYRLYMPLVLKRQAPRNR